MFLVKIYPDGNKQEGIGYIALVWQKILDNGNYDYDDIIRTLQEHMEELGVECTRMDIGEIVNVEGLEALNSYMKYGNIEFFATNHWYTEKGFWVRDIR